MMMDSDLANAMQAAHEARRPTDDRGGSIGLIWRRYTLNGKKLVWHGGTTAGFRSQIVFDPERKVGAIVLSNSNDYGDNLATDQEGPRVVEQMGPLAVEVGEHHRLVGTGLVLEGQEAHRLLLAGRHRLSRDQPTGKADLAVLEAGDIDRIDPPDLG